MAWICVEFHGTGDPFFSGSADDRPLGVSGQFLRGPYNRRTDVARFTSRGEVEIVAGKAPNRRPDGKLGFWEETEND